MANESDERPVADARNGGIVDDLGKSTGGNTESASGPRDPAAVIGNGDEPVKRGRGRPRKDAGTSGGGSGARATDAGRKESTKASVGVDIDGLAMQIVVLHAVLSKVAKAPELAISMEDARALAKSIKEMLKHYSVNVSAKQLAMYQLLGTAAMVYGPRAFAIASRKGKEREAQREAMRRNQSVTVQSGLQNNHDADPVQPSGAFRYN